MKQRSANQYPQQVLESRFASARHNLLLVVIFTVINIILLVTNSDTYFLFSAYIPYILADLGMFLCGRYPSEYYTGEFAGMEIFDSSIFTFMLILAAIPLILYLLSWIFSKRNRAGWLIFALVMFSIDTVLMLLLTGIASESIIDILFHGWVIFSLVSGIIALFKLKKLQLESEETAAPGVVMMEADENNLLDSPMLRFADEEAKARVLLEAEFGGRKIIYRRVKRVNELVVDRRVYDEYVASVEGAHTLCAYVDGHKIEAGYDGAVHSFIVVDGEMIGKKLRVF